MFALPISMPHFKRIIFHQNTHTINLCLQKNAKFSLKTLKTPPVANFCIHAWLRQVDHQIISCRPVSWSWSKHASLTSKCQNLRKKMEKLTKLVCCNLQDKNFFCATLRINERLLVVDGGNSMAWTLCAPLNSALVFYLF